MKKKKAKEYFCPVCIAAPLAVLGAGSGVASSSNNLSDKENKKKKKMKNILIWVSIGLTAISVIFIIMYFKNCKECSSKKLS
jgi:uncharacterized membrane protein YvbJ